MTEPWSDSQRSLMEAARRFAEQSLAPRPPSADFDRWAWDACAREGVLGTSLPSEWGGGAHGALTTVGLFEALGRGGADRGLLFAMSAHLFGVAMAVSRFGSEPQKKYWGGRLAGGGAVGALAITEESGGSSLSGMATVAEEGGAGYRICGAKTLVTNGPVADLFLLIAAENPRRGLLGLTAFLLPRDTPGLSVRQLTPTLGLAAAPMARLELCDCPLPKEAVLGRSGGGFAVMKVSMQWERTCLLAGFLGAAERDLEGCLKYIRGRRDGAGSLYDHQAVSHRLARTHCRLEAARQLLYRGALAVDHQEDPLLWPAMVKLFVGESIIECAEELLRVFAGSGWLDERGAGTALRDVMALMSASGTCDVMLNIISACIK